MAGPARRDKEEILATYGPRFEERPSWQRHGAGIWYETVEKQAYDQKAERQVTALRRRLHHEFHLPAGAEYRGLVAGLTAG
jgi:hypothetical protein